MSKKYRGFTLIELLIVIAIIAVLATISVVTYMGIQQRARDIKRVADVKSLSQALEVYYFNNNSYPIFASSWIEIGNNTDFANAIEVYIQTIPSDPLYNAGGGGNENYSYYYQSTADGQGFKIHATRETASEYELTGGTGNSLSYIVPVPPSTYRLGIGYFPLNSAYNSQWAWDKVKDAAHIAYIQKHWQESLNNDNKDFYNAVADDVANARSQGLKIYLAFEILSADRTHVELPAGLSGDFSSLIVQSAYVDVVRRSAETYKPDYFILNVEANRYKLYNYADYEAYKALYLQAYDAVKAVSSGTNVSASITYEDFNGINCIDSGDQAVFSSYAADFSAKSDILAVSTYPFCYFNPIVIPDNFLTDIASFSTLPLFIAETGWMSESFIIPPSFTFTSSQQIQADYVTRMSMLANNARSQGKVINAINYVSINDMETSICDMLVASNPNLSWYCTLSLIDKNGNEKTAYQKMKEWKNTL